MSAIQSFGYPITATAAANTAVVLTFPSRSAPYMFEFIEASYSAAPTGGRLSMTVGGTLQFDTDITAQGAGPRNVMFQTPSEQAVVLTLAAGGAGAIGKLNVVVN